MLLLFVWLGYGIVSAILLILLTVFIGIDTQYKIPFYRLVQCDMVFSLLTYIFTWISRLYNLELTKPFMIYMYHNYHFVFEVSVFTTHIFYHIQSFSTILFSFYRFAAIRYANGNKIFLKYYGLFYLIIVGYATALVVAQYIFGFIPSVVYNEAKDSFEFRFIDPNKAPIFVLIFNIYSFFYLLVITFCGWLAWRELRIRLSIPTPVPGTRKVMKQMTAIASFHTSIYLVVVVWEVLIGICYKQWDFSTKSCLMITVSDLLSLSMPYLILIFDGPARKMFIRQITRTPTFVPIVSLS